MSEVPRASDQHHTPFSGCRWESAEHHRRNGGGGLTGGGESGGGCAVESGMRWITEAERARRGGLTVLPT